MLMFMDKGVVGMMQSFFLYGLSVTVSGSQAVVMVSIPRLTFGSG